MTPSSEISIRSTATDPEVRAEAVIMMFAALGKHACGRSSCSASDRASHGTQPQGADQ